MDEIILFTIGCPKCKILEKKLKAAGIDFTTVSDVDMMGSMYSIDTDNTFFPLLGVKKEGSSDLEILEFSDAVKYVNSRA